MKMKVTPVDEVSYGVYFWQMPSGALVTDGEGRYLSIPSMRGDIKRIKKIKQAAKSYGLEEGEPIFMSGYRQITDNEYDEQVQRREWGLIPDELDVPALMEDLKQKRAMKIV
jgi:hypothetical protein